MAYDRDVAERVRAALAGTPNLAEKQMFGGLGFLVRGNMALGVHGDRLIVRVGKELYQEALVQPHARPFDLTGRAMTGWVWVDPRGYRSQQDLEAWVRTGLEFALGLPAKADK